MHNRLLNVLATFLLVGSLAGALISNASAADAAPTARMKKLEELMELAVDRFQLNRFIEARAALNRLQSENPTDEEAFRLRKLFGEKIMLEMQRYGDRPKLTAAERQALSLLGETAYALDLLSAEKAVNRAQAVRDAYAKNGYGPDSFEVKRAEALIETINSLQADQPDEFRKVSRDVQGWKEELQSVGNTPLLLLSRAQRYEQSKLRSPEMIARIVGAAVKSPENAQRHMLEIDRLGSYAVPALVNYLRDNKDDASCTNAHFILLCLGQQATAPLCETLKSNDQLLLQQVSSILGDMQPHDMRAVPYLKAVYENKDNLSSTRDTAAIALENITGQKADKLLSAADYFLDLANHYYFGGPAIDQEITDMNQTLWVWNPEADKKQGALQQAEAPIFILSDLLAEEAAYRGMALATSKVPYQVMLASIFIQQKIKADTISKLLFREDMSFPDAEKVRAEANNWRARLTRNMRVVYSLGSDYLSAVLEKAIADQKTEVAIASLDALTLTAGSNGWETLIKSPRVDSGLQLTARVRNSLKTSVPTTPATKSTTPATTPATPPASSGAGASGDAEAAPAAETTTIAKSSEFTNSAADAPVQALNNKNERIAIAAANCLARIGLPTTNPAYAELLPLLVKGAEENRATVALIISNEPNLRDRFSKIMEKDQIIPMVATEGYGGYTIATQYPPKDAIFIDNSIDQFGFLRLQLELRNVSHGKVLPVTIITTRDHAANIAEQFTKDTLQAQAKEQRSDIKHLVDGGNNMYDSQPWRVVVRHNVEPDSKEIYDDIATLGRYGSDSLPIVILTNPTREGREQLKKSLMLRAERELRPEGLSEYARLLNQEKVMGDIFGVRITYVPVFLDEEVAGFDAMNTVQALQTDPRTRPVPIAILTDAERVKDVEKDFEFFIKDNKVRILSRDIEPKQLVDSINKMKAENALSQQNFSRALSNNIALRSAQAMSDLTVTAYRQGLSSGEQKQLVAVAADTSRPEDLRVAAVEALGHFRARAVIESLMSLFTDTEHKNVRLRTAILRSVGEIDLKNEFMDFKLQAMSDPEVAIQEEAAKALGPAAQGTKDIGHYLDTLRPNNPLSLLNGIEPAKSSAAQENPPAAEAETKQPEEATTAAPEKTTDEAPKEPVEEPSTEKTEDNTEKKAAEKTEDTFNW